MRLIPQIFIISLAVVLVFPTASHSIYVDDQDRSKADHTPTHLIIKLTSDVNVKSGTGPGSTVTTGLPSLDALHQKYQVLSQEPLLRPSAIRAPDNPLQRVFLVNISDGVDPEAMTTGYRQLDIVEYAHLDNRAEFYDIPNDSLFMDQWFLNNTGRAVRILEKRDRIKERTMKLRKRNYKMASAKAQTMA